ncbi:MAG: polysaccharide pyruvyl transferase family protein [Ruminococcus sp.]
MKLKKRLRKKLSHYFPSVKRKEFAQKQEPETKVLIAGLMNGNNMGDNVISDCTSYLLKKSARGAGIKKLKISTVDFRRQKDKKSLNAVRNTDLVVFPGGGFIKYNQENFPDEMNRIVSLAEHYGIPVIYNAMGVEGYSEKSEECLKQQDMLCLFSNRYITSRDFSDLLNSTYLKNTAIKSKRVADPAVWSGEVYGIERDVSSDVIGLGVARRGLFVDYGVPLTGEDLLSMWAKIIGILDQKGIKWKLFTNGLRQDEDFLTELIAYLGLEDKRREVSLPAPAEPRELLKHISGFKGIIACRMHASIIAFSLGVPSVGLVWNDKLRYFGESIGHPERFLEYREIKNENFIVESLEKAISEGYSKEILEKEKESAFRSVDDFFAPFAKNLLESRRRDLTKIKLVCYGLPNLKSEKLNTELFQTEVAYYISDCESEIGTVCLGKPVYSSNKLKSHLRKRPFVIVSETVDYTPVAQKLMSFGYKEKYDFTNMHSYKRYVFKKGDVFIDSIAANTKG